MRNAFPFSAIVGQDEMKLALMIAATDPTIGGVMVFGDRGTGKSTAVRALAAVLPKISVVKGCAFTCDPARSTAHCASVCTLRTSPGANPATVEAPIPVVDLPLGATEDRVVGALDLERALSRGEKAFQGGLLARAHRGFLYIDEVNLLEDHLVDLLLDVAASGENVVEREGLSVRHDARFVLVGSGNPEEGELRPQLLDRFGLSVEVKTPTDIEERIEVLRRRDAYDRDPTEFEKAWTRKNAKVRTTLVQARRNLPTVTVPESALALIARFCGSVGADGLRGELTLMRAARAIAAIKNASQVGPEHIRKVATMSLRHRLRRNPLDQSGSAARIERTMAEIFAPTDTRPDQEPRVASRS